MGKTLIPFLRIRPEEEYHAPKRHHLGDAGFDLVISRYAQVFPGQIAHLSTNIAMQAPLHAYGLILPRSSALYHKGLHVSPGIIDTGYRGEVMILVRNMIDRSIHINPGDRVAQMLIVPMWHGEFMETDKLSPGDRGDSGFGSTGD